MINNTTLQRLRLLGAALHCYFDQVLCGTIKELAVCFTLTLAQHVKICIGIKPEPTIEPF